MIRSAGFVFVAGSLKPGSGDVANQTIGFTLP